MIHENVVCDICGVEKKETNHWFAAVEDKGTLRLSPLETLNRKRRLVKHLCGHRCVHRLIDYFLAGHSLNDLSPGLPSELTENSSSDQTDKRDTEVLVDQ